MEAYIVHGESAQIFVKRKAKLEINLCRKKSAGYPIRFVNNVKNDF